MTDFYERIRNIIDETITESRFDDVEELQELILAVYADKYPTDNFIEIKKNILHLLETEYNIDDAVTGDTITNSNYTTDNEESMQDEPEVEPEQEDNNVAQYYCRSRFHRITMSMDDMEPNNFPKTQLLYCLKCNREEYFDYEDGKEIELLNNRNIDFLVNFNNMTIDKGKKTVSDYIPHKQYHESDKEYGLYAKIKRSEEFLRKQVEYLLTVPQPEQRTEAWYRLREGRLTASDLATALNESKYDKPIDLVLKKCGLGPPFKGNKHTEWGVKYEPIATMIYEQRNNVKVIEFGLMPHPTIPFLGASPDGITPEGMMLEIKCPPVRAITGIIPHNYWLQMQLQLETCDLEECDFLECRLTEYLDEEEYYEDKYEDELKTFDNMEKGVLITYDAPTEDEPYKKRYIYPDRIGLTQDEINAWCEEKGKEFDDQGVPYVRNYWRLEKLSCVRVDRNRKWFEVKLPVMKAFWKDICFYRSIGCDELLEKKNKNKRPRKTNNNVLEDFAFLSGTDDEFEPIEKKSNKNNKSNKSNKNEEADLEEFAFLSDSGDSNVEVI